MSVSKICDLDIAQAAKLNDLDDACYHLQNIAGITDGGVASVMFSDVDLDWTKCSIEYRTRLLQDWINVERSYE